jgi:hypothetical protein
MDFLREVPDDAGQLDTRLQASPDILLERQYASSPGEWQELEPMPSFRKGLVYVGKVDRFIADLLASCDGRRPLGEVLTGLAASRGVDRLTLISPSCRIVRLLIERGFLLPVHLPGEARP